MMHERGKESMRLARVKLRDEPTADPRWVVVGEHDATEWQADVNDALGDLADGSPLEADPHAQRWSLDELEWLVPLQPTSEVFCVGFNYLEHQVEAAELMGDVPDHPVIFTKSQRALCGPSGELLLPAEVSTQFDWEVELGVVIGREAFQICEADVEKHVAGYTVVNDVTARDLQTRHSQWFIGKNMYASTPLGPWIVPRTDCAFPPVLPIGLTVNGETKQKGSTADMLFGVARLVAVISSVLPLRPGDVIATGTPSGVGFKRKPPQFLSDGDVVDASIEGVGSLRHTVRTASNTIADVIAAQRGGKR
jgi:2-keto-4-pentenoate hydratase/2-oxohepta-3-ene-1,7-dioic acid hydratase in catechol pathway